MGVANSVQYPRQTHKPWTVKRGGRPVRGLNLLGSVVNFVT